MCEKEEKYMITARLKNTDINNIDCDDKIKKGLEFLKETDFSKLEDGKHVLSDDMYVNVQTYTTKSDADFEAHRDYVDIQYMISGEELIGVTNYSDCKTTVPYDREKDIEFLSGKGNYTEMYTGDFMVLYPDDAHKPSISIDRANPAKVRKAVVKVKIQ